MGTEFPLPSRDPESPQTTSQVDITLVTSLYRAEVYLKRYGDHLKTLGTDLEAKGLRLEIILIANDPTAIEKAQIQEMVDSVKDSANVSVIVKEVPLETIYASWNRGFGLAKGRCVGPWNVDDIRSAAALVEGHMLIAAGHSVVYFPYTMIYYLRFFGKILRTRRILQRARPFDKAYFASAMRGASFWLCDRTMLDRVGPFDENFRIAGDFEWFRRALEITDFHPGNQLAGEFHLHGNNVSDTGNPLQVVEENIVHLRHGAWALVVPAQPDLMRESWEQWGNQGNETPDHIEDKLWGPSALTRWRAWMRLRHRKRYQKRVSEALRTIPRFIIDRTHLRPYLARLGIVKSDGPRRNS